MQERDRGKVRFGSIGGVVKTRIECWSLIEYQRGEVGNQDGVGNVFYKGLPEERSARRWRRWRQVVSRFLDPTNHAGAVRDVKHPIKLLGQGEVGGPVIQTILIISRRDFVPNASPVIGEGPLRTQNVRGEHKFYCHRGTHEVCLQYRISDLWR